MRRPVLWSDAETHDIARSAVRATRTFVRGAEDNGQARAIATIMSIDARHA